MCGWLSCIDSGSLRSFDESAAVAGRGQTLLSPVSPTVVSVCSSARQIPPGEGTAPRLHVETDFDG